MLIKSIRIILCFLVISTSFADTRKEAIDRNYKFKMNDMRQRLSQNCLDVLSPVINALEASHKLFLNDQPLDAALKNVEIIRVELPAYKNSGCNLSWVTYNMSAEDYVWYYLRLSDQIERTPEGPTPTDFEKFQLVNVVNSIRNKIENLCHEVTCDDNKTELIKYCDLMDEEMLSEHIDYYRILGLTNNIKRIISQAFYLQRISDKRYYEALTWILSKMKYLYKVPGKYLFELNEPHDFRHYIASEFVRYLMNYNNMDNLNVLYIGAYSDQLYSAAKSHNMNILVGASIRLTSMRYYASYKNSITDAAADQFIAYIVDWFNNETYSYFMSWYETQKDKKKSLASI